MLQRRIILIAGLFGIDHSPLQPWLGVAAQRFVDGNTVVLPASHDDPAVLLNVADCDEIYVVAHSFGVARFIRDAKMIEGSSARVFGYCIDGVQAYRDGDKSIRTVPDPLAQLGRPAFSVPSNVVECHHWRRSIDPISSLFPLALSSPMYGANVTDTEVSTGTDALGLLGSIFGGPVGATVGQLIQGQIGHNSIVAAVMPKVMQLLAAKLT